MLNKSRHSFCNSHSRFPIEIIIRISRTKRRKKDRKTDRKKERNRDGKKERNGERPVSYTSLVDRRVRHGGSPMKYCRYRKYSSISMSITPAAIKGFFPPVRGWIRKLSVRLWRYLRTDIFTRARARVSECYEVYEVYEFITARGLVSVKRSFISDVYLAYLSLFFFLVFFPFPFY